MTERLLTFFRNIKEGKIFFKGKQAVSLSHCNDPKLPIDNIDRHIMKYGRACLAVQAEISKRWPPGSKIVDFIDKLVIPFLAWQAYYDAYQKPPPWGERSHHGLGILEFYADSWIGL